MTNVGIIDYGSGNVFSLARAVEEIGCEPKLLSEPRDLKFCHRLILPGVGAFHSVMDKLKSKGFGDAIVSAVEAKKPLLGICVGMQVLFQNSEEFGKHNGLGLLKGQIKKIEATVYDDIKYNVPNVGWCTLNKIQSVSSKSGLNKIIDLSRIDNTYYFVHSFSAIPEEENIDIATIDYGSRVLVAAVSKENMYGVQFHPERSGVSGLELLEKFSQL